MTDDLISKKELLDLTGISYGQLYRWKRKNLIPEEWFIRKSSYTGQETFFPKQQILPRIDKIIHMKEGLSLDELADVFSPSLGEVEMSAQQLLDRNIVSLASLELLTEAGREQSLYGLEQIMMLYVLERLLMSGDITRQEGSLLIEVMSDHYYRFRDRASELLLIRKMGVPTFMLVGAGAELYFDQGVKVVLRITLATFMEELKLKLGNV
ncbi:YhbD family protein [Paenibacillus tundrae]|uniref:DNA-binding transcriptional MerR regulator n=1 Tax=Paenibacillus tundrae TaxID=528187 RepID=A0ABT9WGQ2_9BACL|nr:YhbD family protein [Paenibacillus tundrae]MDQ0172449.1 DNA-binding transcriptional MerR regulator [Paenibacillus tundrae]